MKILNIFKRPELKEVQHIEVFPERELSRKEVKGVVTMQRFWNNQLRKIYRELNA